MQEKKLKYLAAMGIVSGLLVASNPLLADQKTETKSESLSSMDLNESELLDELNEKGKQQYKSLDAQGRAMALRAANQECKGNNECKGLNNCKSKANSCMGLGLCKGQADCSFTDKNQAVKVVYDKKMAEKRNNLSK